MHDAHIHLDFMENGEQLARDAAADGCRLFSSTVSPAGFVAARERFAAFDNVAVGLGMHPWWVAAGEGEFDPVRPGESMTAVQAIAAFEALVDETRFIGEIGLDLGKHHVAAHDAQLAAFEGIARLCAERGGKVVSLHSVHAARETLDVLEATGALDACTCIFHWFSGPSDQLKRAIQAGCLFSVGKRMLATGKGREYVKAIPADRLLLETDYPPQRGQACAYADLREQLESVANAIAAIKGLTTALAFPSAEELLSHGGSRLQ